MSGPVDVDVIIVGGGINGAALANLASHRGLTAALFEKGDFAGGTSSKSTKLIHGGLRYLENFEFGLVREALRERYFLCRQAAHLVHPLRFIIPVYQTSPRPLWMMRLGVWLYDALSGRYCLERHRALSRDEVAEALPGIATEGLLGGVRYTDAQMDDARLCLENVLAARERGAVVKNYTEVTDLIVEAGRVRGVRVRDAVSGETRAWRSHAVVSAAGPWTQQLSALDPAALTGARVRATKGTHVVYRGRLSDDAVLIQSRDGRVFFVIPWGAHSLIGTTDTDYDGDPDRVTPAQADIDYLFSEAARVFPLEKFSADDIITTFAGLRPLVFQKGRPGQVSRSHRVERSGSGLIYILGGKYTTYRVIAADALRAISEHCPDARAKITSVQRDDAGLDADMPVYGGGELSAVPADNKGISSEFVAYARALYGSRAPAVFTLMRQNPALAEPICSCTPAVRAQLVYAVQSELARAPDDIIWRRLGLAYHDCVAQDCRRAVAEFFSSQNSE